MDFYGDRLIKLRNEKNLDFVGLTSQYDKLDYNNMKRLVAEVEPIRMQANGKSFTFTYERGKILKAMYGDIEYFYTRMIIQENTLYKSINDLGNDWATVTAYYYSFFAATTFLRLAHEGTLYIEREVATRVHLRLQQFSPLSTFSQGNYNFKLCNNTLNTIDLVLENSSSVGVHENTWIMIDSLIKTLCTSVSEVKSEEFLLMTKILEINNQLGNRYPSKTRNIVNYHAKYGYETIKNTLKKDHIIKNDNLALKRILTFKINDYGDNVLPVDLIFSYGVYISLIVNFLYIDMLSRMSGKKDVEKMRAKYLKLNPITPETI